MSGNTTTDPAISEEEIITLMALTAASLKAKGYTAGQIAELARLTKSALEDVNASLISLEDNQIICIKKNGAAIAAVDHAVDITVPTQTSELTNNSGYITGVAVDDKLREAGYLSKQIVEKLPDPSTASDKIIYCVPQSGGTAGNQYKEYHLVNGNFEIFGLDEQVLSDYATTEYVSKAQTAQISNIVENQKSTTESYLGTENLAEFWRQIKPIITSADADLSARVDLLEMIVANKEVTGNPFTISFDTLDGIEAEGGVLKNNALYF